MTFRTTVMNALRDCPAGSLRRWMVMGLALLLLAIGVFFAVRQFNPRPVVSAPLRQAVYIWQEAWSPAVAQATLQAGAHFNGFMVFASEIVVEGDSNFPSTHPKEIDWTVLAQAGRPVTLVIRANDRAVRSLISVNDQKTAADLLAREARDRLTVARAAGVNVAGVQLDFDCPTARLREYRQLLEAVRPRIVNVEFSITALPTWLASREFRPLVRRLSYFVLQLHSIKAPRTINDPVELLDTARLNVQLQQAAKVGIPFYVALPTYAYLLFFDDAGRCTGFAAEGERATGEANAHTRVVGAPPEPLARIVGQLGLSRPAACRGIVWFRLPVATDTLNWPWPTLLAVMAGRAPRQAYAAEVRSPSPGLFEIWLRNTGECTIGARLKVPIELSGQRPFARDALAGWRWTDGETALQGPAPAVGETRMIAWLRLITPAHAATTNPSPLVTSGKVEILP